MEELRHYMDFALTHGADKARLSQSKSVENIISTLNGEIDKVSRCQDCSLSISLFVDGRFGTFSTNKTVCSDVEDFILRAIQTTRILSPDSFRDLPGRERHCLAAVTGRELEVYDPAFETISDEKRRELALSLGIFGRPDCPGELVSEEGEYSDEYYDNITIDSDGLYCRHTESNFDYYVEMTIQDGNGDRYAGDWWESSSHFDTFDAVGCAQKALSKAFAQIGSEPVKSGKYNLVLDSECASKVVSPILRAINAYSLQQHNSFLMDSLGKKLFPDGLTIMDLPRIKGQTCSKLFDSEGVPTIEGPIVDHGVIDHYFVNTYMSAKMGIAPTVEDYCRPKVMPWPVEGLSRNDIMAMCKDGILVTEFNGGNSNPTTGDFSFGISGFHFKDGKIVKPVSEMLITGNILKLWENFIAAGDDARSCMSKLIPTLAFSKVDFSG